MTDLTTLQSEQYDEFWKYIPTSFTDGVTSRFSSFVTSLSNDQASFLKEIYDFKDNLNVLTANTQGVTAWEAFLQLPDRPDLTLQARRGRLFSRMSPLAGTLETIKNVVKNYIGSDQFSVFEYQTLNDPVSAFCYEIQINVSSTVSYIKTDLEDDLKRLQPEHCQLVRIIDPFKYLTDTTSASDSATVQLISIFLSDISPCDNPDYIVAL